jgi:hypothetical protein
MILVHTGFGIGLPLRQLGEKSLKFRAKYIILLATAMVAQSPAHAASVFMLQFGSYQSADEARSRLDEVKAKHAGVLSRLETSVRPVPLPPDNLVVYRTQAGPLATRADAQLVCSQLASNGDSCYIVETAIAAASPSASVALTNAPKPATPVAEPAARDAQNIAALSAVANPPAIQPTTIAAEENAQASAINELDSAVSRQRVLEQSPPPNSSTTKPPRRSFWDRLNPFSTPEKNTPTALVEPSLNRENLQTAAPVEVVEDGRQLPVLSAVPPAATIAASPPPTNQVPEEVNNVLPAPITNAPFATTDSNRLSIPTADASTVAAPTAPAAITSVNLPSSKPNGSPPLLKAEPYPLPPPPAPLRAAATALPSSSVTTSGNAAGSVAASAAPLPTGTLPNIRVEEAKRVPLSASTAPAIPAPSLPAVNLSPSSTLGQRTIWAQIGQFTTPQDALAFWNQYRQTHPDFPVVRVRVTTPVSAQTRGIALVNLRVGPFAKTEFVNNLCASIDPNQGMICGAIADMGVAVNPYATHGAGQLSSSRYKR